MSSPSSQNNTSGEANRSGNDAEGQLLPQDRNQSKMDTIEDLKKKLEKLEEKNLELSNQHHQNMSHYEKEIMKLRLELERGESLRQALEREMSLARRAAQVQMDSAEEELCDAKAKLLKLQARWGEPRNRPYNMSAIQIPSGGTLYVTSPVSGTNTASANWRDQNYSQHFGPLQAADHPTPNAVRCPSDTDLHRYWRPCAPPSPAFLFPSCSRGRSYNSPGPSGSYVIVMPSSSRLDSSYVSPSSTSSCSNPSSWSGQATGSGCTFNSSSSFRPSRSHSLPPCRSFSGDISSRSGRNQAWM